MTTEEQKAEEIANKRCHEIMCFGHCNFSSPKHHRCGEWHREYNCALDGYHEGFKDCAKARLNVTTVSDCPIKDEWHYVKNGDLPKNENRIWLCFGVDDYNDGQFIRGRFWCDCCGWFDVEEVIAWQTLVPPKEIE